MVWANKKWRTEAEEAFADWEGEFECSLAKSNGVGIDIYLAGVGSRESTGWSRELRRSVHDFIKILDGFARCLFERADSYPLFWWGARLWRSDQTSRNIYCKGYFSKIAVSRKEHFFIFCQEIAARRFMSVLWYQNASYV